MSSGTLRNKLMPWWFGPPAISGLGSRAPYARIERSINSDATLITGVLVGLLFYAVAKVLSAIFGAAA